MAFKLIALTCMVLGMTACLTGRSYCLNDVLSPMPIVVTNNTPVYEYHILEKTLGAGLGGGTALFMTWLICTGGSTTSIQGNIWAFMLSLCTIPVGCGLGTWAAGAAVGEECNIFFPVLGACLLQAAFGYVYYELSHTSGWGVAALLSLEAIVPITGAVLAHELLARHVVTGASLVNNEKGVWRVALPVLYPACRPGVDGYYLETLLLSARF